MSAPSDGRAAAIGLLVVIAVRVLDWLLPSGGHFHTPWIHDDEDDEEDHEDAY